MIIPDTAGLNANIEAGGLNQVAAHDSLSIIPPGESRIEFTGSGLVVRVFSSDATDLINLAENLNHYIDPNPDIAPLVAWLDPIDGFKIRYYKLSDYSKGDSNMRVFRTAKLMINPLLKRVVPRDITKLSPHQHSDCRDLIFDFEEMVAFWSRFGLVPGDLISTGTPEGVALHHKPDPMDWYLKPGDIVEAGVDGIGVLETTIV